jgi:multimeric flavodoxin WrbA
MQVVCLLASPRVNGNSATMANWFCDEMAQHGATIQKFMLNKLDYRGCQACMTCKTKLDRCVLKDDLTAVLDAVRTADVLALATPVYYADISSQLKGFVDRSYSYLAPDFFSAETPCRLEPGKKLVFIQAQAMDETQYDDIFPRYRTFFKFYGFRDCRLIRACSVGDIGAVSTRSDLETQTRQTARELSGK